MAVIRPEKMVTLKYTMRSHFVDGTFKDHPAETITFIYGVERQVPSLEKSLEGCGPGEKKSITIPAEEIYGDHDPSLIREIPKKGLIKQRLVEGQIYRQMKMGTLVSFKVVKVGPHTVVADFNQPLAGIKVSMDFEITDIRDATDKEVEKAMEMQMKKSIGCG
jgi:FKBP-type peptidyl-prolyl cis-trans isomerase SlyD